MVFMKKLAVIGFFILCLSAAFVSGEELDDKPMNIELLTKIGEKLYLNVAYDNLFTLDKRVNCSEKDTVTVAYNFSKDNILVKEDFFTRNLNSCTKVSGSTGTFTPAEIGNYTLCGTITNSSVAGTYPSLVSCTEFEVIGASEISCDISLQLKTNKTIFYENGQSIEFKPELSNKSFPFVIEYWIEDLFGDIVKPKINTTNTNEKSWKTNIEEQDRVLFLKAMVYPSCNDLDFSNNAVEKMFIVTNPSPVASSAPSSTKKISESPHEGASNLNSSITITKISPETISFGDLVNAELEIYKGDTDKYSVSVWAEKNGKVISKKTKAHLKNKNTQYKLTLPLLIDPNCNEKIKEGDADVVVEGLGLQEEKEFTLEGINKELCPEKETIKKDEPKKEKPTKTEETKKQTKITNQSLPLLSQSEQSQPLFTAEKVQKKEIPGYRGLVVYESVSEKSKNLVSWVLFVAFGLLSLALAMRKN